MPSKRQAIPKKQGSKELAPVKKFPQALVSAGIQSVVASFLDPCTLTNFFKGTCKQLRMVDPQKYSSYLQESMISDTRIVVGVDERMNFTNSFISIFNCRNFLLTLASTSQDEKKLTSTLFHPEARSSIRQVAISGEGHRTFVVSTSGKVFVSHKNTPFQEVSRASGIVQVFPSRSPTPSFISGPLCNIDLFVDKEGRLKKHDEGKGSASQYIKGIPSPVKTVINSAPGQSPAFAITEEGDVYVLDSLRRNSQGEEGIGRNNTDNGPCKVENVHGIINIISLNKATFFLGKNRVWACGTNPDGRLGTGNTEVNHLYPCPVLNVTDVVEIAGSKISYGIFTNYTIFRGKNGEIWISGGKAPSPSRLALPPIKRVAFHRDAIFFMGEKGVWVMGMNKGGQLGLVGEEFYNTPQSIPAFENEEIWQITAIEMRSAYSTLKESVYIFQGKSPDLVWMPPALIKPSNNIDEYKTPEDFMPRSIKTFPGFLPAGKVRTSYIDCNVMLFIMENNGELALYGKRIEYLYSSTLAAQRVFTAIVPLINQIIPKEFLVPTASVAKTATTSKRP